MAYGLVKEMNALHYGGYGVGESETTTGVAYFNPIAVQYGASRLLEINRAIDEDRSLIAAASGDGNGFSNGSGRQQRPPHGPAQADQGSPEPKRTSTNLRVLHRKPRGPGRRAKTMLKNQNALINQINNQRQSVMGVNIDEEMMDIIKFQQAFNAIARYITTVDEMLDRIINGMGIVGR